MTVRLALDVWHDGATEPVGALNALDNGAIEFRYTHPRLQTGQPISLSLPLQEEPIGDAVARAFFDNLLPENQQIQLVIDREGLDRSAIVDILFHVGADCAGAISCLPEGSPPIKVPGDLAEDYRPLDEGEIATIVARLADNRPLPGQIDDPSPVAGIQNKIALTLLPDGRLALPRDGRKVPTTHILKVPRRAEAADALHEDAACKLAAAVGFDVSRSEQLTIAGTDALLIERFDRVVVDGVVYRLHQEDFAQALGLPSLLKYERNGVEGRRFDTGAIRSVLERLARPALARERFVMATLFNLAIGNTDNHAKNYGVLYDLDGNPHLAPLYDLLPIRLHRRYTHQLAYNLGGAPFFDGMTQQQMAAFLAEFGYEGARATRFVDGRVRPMLEILDRETAPLRGIGLRFFDDLVGRELNRLTDLLGIEMAIRERDYFSTEPVGGWPGAS